MFTSTTKNTWVSGNDVLFATPEAAQRFATESGISVDVEAAVYPARGFVNGTELALSSSGSVRMMVEQLMMGQDSEEKEVCTKQTYTSVCGRSKLH